MNVLDLFSGIGGFSLGLERAGMHTVAFCEIEPFPQAVLRKHWPDIPIYGDIRELTAKRLAEDGIGTIDVICGGFPCQDISVAGKGAGLSGSRSGLWREYKRLIFEIRPKFVLVENVPALLARGIDRVLGNLAEIGYDAEWYCIPGSAVGASHIRNRVWIIAYPHCKGLQERFMRPGIQKEAGCYDHGKDFAVDAWWQTRPNLVRGIHGIPGRVDRVKALGNAVIPQIPEIIGRAIMQAEGLSSNTLREGF